MKHTLSNVIVVQQCVNKYEKRNHILGCKIITLNLTRELTEEELKVLFEPHGENLSCDLVLDKDTGVSKGFGFVEMGLDSEADIAIKTLHETRVKTKKIRVKLAKQS